MNFKSSCKFLKLFSANNPSIHLSSSKQRSTSVHIFHSSVRFDILQRIIEFSSQHFYSSSLFAIVISLEVKFRQPSSNNQLHSSVRSSSVCCAVKPYECKNSPTKNSRRFLYRRISSAYGEEWGWCHGTHMYVEIFNLLLLLSSMMLCGKRGKKAAFYTVHRITHNITNSQRSIELDLFNFQRFSPPSPVTVFATWLRSQRSHSGSISNGEKWPKTCENPLKERESRKF